MKARICPYCDSIMSRKHRCDACGSFVWNAAEMDITYKTDDTENYKFGELFQPSPDSQKKQSKKTQSPKPHPYAGTDAAKAKNKKNAQTNNYRTQTPASSPYQKRNETQKKKSKAGIYIFIIIIILFFLMRFMQNHDVSDFIDSVTEIFEGSSSSETDSWSSDAADTISEYDMYNFEVTNAEENYENGIWDYKEGRELTQAEVIEGGKECSQMAHMDLLADDAAAAMEQFYEQKGIEYDVIEDEPFNAVYHSGDREYTSFMMTVTVGVKDSYDEYFYIDADSYSERVHALWGYTEDEAAAEQMLAVMYETASGEKLTDSQISLCMDFGEEDYKFTEIGNLEIYTTFSDGAYYSMSVGPL